MLDRRARLDAISPPASPAETAAIVAALARFARETVPRATPSSKGLNPWLRAAMLEGVARQDRGDAADYQGDLPDVWINT